jgi:hypothetical protein
MSAAPEASLGPIWEEVWCAEEKQLGAMMVLRAYGVRRGQQDAQHSAAKRGNWNVTCMKLELLVEELRA